MRCVLRALREELGAARGALRAYVFIEDRLDFLAEGNPGVLQGALDRARSAAEISFRSSDHKRLWGPRRDSTARGPDRERLLDALRRVPAEAGFTSEISEYPWAGGDWLMPSA